MEAKPSPEQTVTGAGTISPEKEGSGVEHRSSAFENVWYNLPRVKMLMASAIFAALVSLFFGSGHGDRHPYLRNFLESSNNAAMEAIGSSTDVESITADPRRWLNPAGHDLLSEVTGFERRNSSMLWGTYRPGVYFGFKTRTSPVAVTAGLMWPSKGSSRSGVETLRHECSEGDGLGPYGWVEHDGLSYGKQEITDERAGVQLVTLMVKPAQLVDHGKSSVVEPETTDVALASRVAVFPLPSATATDTSPRFSTVYLYVGLDCNDGESGATGVMSLPCVGQIGDGAELRVVDADAPAGHPLVIRGKHARIGTFDVEASASLTGDAATSGRATAGNKVSIAYVGKKGLPLVDVKRMLERIQVQKSFGRRQKAGKIAEPAEEPFTLPNEMEAGSNVVLLQFTGQAPFSVDLVVRAPVEAFEPLMNGDDRVREPIPFGKISEWLAIGSRSFSDRFEKTFSLRDKGFGPQHVAAAKAALSNMLGGMGYFTGRSLVRSAGQDGDSGDSFEVNLFTAVPSRSFFPRGFLWDEGFHQLVISAWDVPTSIDVLGHWLSVMHVHSSEGVEGGWLPREQILGEEARRRVPREFMAQDVAVANPPTLLLLVDSLLRDLAEPSGERNDADASAEVCSAEGGDRSGSRAGRPASPTWDRTARESTVEFLRKAHPVLDQWVRWLLITQRPGAQGWGGQAKDSPAPVGAFQWRGRDADDNRLNALTLASGLDDYPRASHPSENEEWHVDVLCWIALACGVMDRLSTALSVESLSYGDLHGEIVGGLFEFHWDDKEEAFFDYGPHASDGKLVREVLMRCRKADGSTTDIGASIEDIRAQKHVCPPNQQGMYPLGDGRGGLLERKRWRGGQPRSQHVRHIGYVSIFPLLLKLLSPDSSTVGSLLAHMRDPKHLWSPHGLRSLSASDPLYQVENNPGDEPYWRGHIWVNVNYLALASLRHYSQVDGPFRKEADTIYSELRTNLLSTLLGGFHRTGYFWEQYDDRSGAGLRSHPFTGWTALVVLIMAEMY